MSSEKVTNRTAAKKAFADRLRRGLERRGWSQSDLARELGVKPAVVSRWVAAIHLPSSAALRIVNLILAGGGEQLLTAKAAPLYKEAGTEVERKLRVLEAPKPYGARTRRVSRLLREIDDLVNSGDDLVVRHLERQIELLKDSVAHRKEKKDKA